MTSAAARADVDWVGAAAGAASPAADPRTLHLLARLAQFVAFPIGRAHESYCAAPPLSDAALRALAEQPAFRRPLNALAARNAGFAQMEIDPKLFKRLGAEPQTRLCVLLVVAEAEELRRAGAYLAAAIAHRKAVAILAREERAKLLAALEEDAFALAVREAPLQYQALADLSDAATLNRVMDMRQSPEALRESLHTLGYRAIEDFVAFCEPDLAPFLARRLRGANESAARAEGRFARAHVGPFMRLMRRRFQQWETFIG
jgi:hypothetical protein